MQHIYLKIYPAQEKSHAWTYYIRDKKTLTYLEVSIFVSPNIHKPLSFEFGVNGKFVVRFFFFRMKIIAFSSGCAMWQYPIKCFT